MGKNFLFYTIASTVIAIIAQALGADLFVTFMASLVGPPFLLLMIGIARYKGWLSIL